MRRNPDLIALLIVCGFGLPLVYAVAAAYADGEVRRRETPLRAVLGPQAFGALRAGEPTQQHYMGDDRRVPDFTLRHADGTEWRMSDRRGKVVVMNFWTATCQPCVEEMPSFVSLARILESRDDVELVTIAADRDWETANAIVPEDSPLQVLLDPDRSVVSGRFGTRLFPETWIVDPRGIIRLRIDGRRNWADPVILDVIESYL